MFKENGKKANEINRRQYSLMKSTTAKSSMISINQYSPMISAHPKM